MKINYDVILLYEHKDRELDSAIALSNYLTKKMGYSVGIYSIVFDLFYLYKNVGTKVLCLPYCRSIENIAVKLFKKKHGDKVLFVNLNYEQLLSPYTKLIKKPQDDFARSELYHFTWGSYFKNYLLENGVKNKNIVITGKIENTLLKDKYWIKKSQIRYNISKNLKIDSNKKWIFLPLNDGVIFEKESVIKKSILRGYANDNSYVFREYVQKTVLNLLNLVCKIGNEGLLNDYILILRPHPSVSVSDYKYFLASNKIFLPDNLIICRDYSSKEWVSCVDICITNYSTVALDSSFLGVPTYVFEPFKRPEFASTDWIDYFGKIKTQNDFLRILNKDFTKDSSKLLNQFIVTELNSIFETSEAIKKLLMKSIEIKLTNKSFFHIKDFFKILRSLIFKFDAITSFKQISFSRKGLLYDYVSTKEMKNRIINYEKDIK
jgi:surface carbohydrate biosynthesis protein